MSARRRRAFGFWIAACAALLLAACQQPAPPGHPAQPSAMSSVEGDDGTTHHPVGAAGNFLAGMFAGEERDLGAAASFLKSALAQDPDNVTLMQRTFTALAADGQLDEARAIAQRELKFAPDETLAATLLIEQDAKAGHWAAVATRAQGLPARGMNTLLTPLVLAWARMGEGHADLALGALAPLTANPREQLLHDFHAALICDLADRREQAETLYRNALAHENGRVLATVESAAAFYRRIGKPEAAAEVIAKYRQDRDDPTFVDLEAATRPVGSPRAGLAEAFFEIASTLRQGEAPDMALIFARLALDLQSDFALDQLLAAGILEDMGRLDAADRVLAGIDPASPVGWTAQLRRASNLDQLDRFDDAAHALETLAAAHPDRPESLITLGDILRRHQKWTEAAAAYDRAIAKLGKPSSRDWTIYYSRGIALHESNQWPRAESDFLTALDLQPEQPDVLNYLGYTWIEKGENFERARSMIESAAKARPTDGFIVDSLGWLYFRSGQYDKAVAQLEHAVELVPDDATITDHLGNALWAVGRTQEARYQWRQALIFKPEPDLKAEIERKLRDGYTVPAPLRSSSETQTQ